jgi:hypothetical protein
MPMLAMAVLRTISSALLLLSFIGFAHAQEAVQTPFSRGTPFVTETPEAVLAGTSSRRWTLMRTATYTANDPCLGHQTVYRFYTDGHMTIEKCVNRGPGTTSHRWAVQSKDRDVSITIDDVTYGLLFKRDTTGTRIILRTKSRSIIDPVSDQEFLLSEQEK